MENRETKTCSQNGRRSFDHGNLATQGPFDGNGLFSGTLQEGKLISSQAYHRTSKMSIFFDLLPD